MTKKFQKFAALVKVDAEKREVWGVAAEESPDKDGEIFDYKSSKPYFEKWSAEIAKATDGKSLGNVRSMHDSVAAGKLIHLEFRDAEKQIFIGAKIVDDAEWQKVAEGVYTGFSIGGRYVKTWKDGGELKYTANPVEISVVDNPCMYGAHFEMVKAAGDSETKQFAQKNTNARKSLYDVGDLACVIANLQYITSSLTYEADYEGDGSTIPARLKAVQADLVDILKDLAEEEGDESVGSIPAPESVLEMSAQKSGTAAEEQTMNDEMKKALETQATAHGTDLAKVSGELDSLRKTVETQAQTVKTMGENIEKLVDILKTIPATPKAAVRAVGKEADGTPAGDSTKETKKTAVDLMKDVHAGGGKAIVLGGGAQ